VLCRSNQLYKVLIEYKLFDHLLTLIKDRNEDIVNIITIKYIIIKILKKKKKIVEIFVYYYTFIIWFSFELMYH